jgi:hypothetical protein
MTLLPIVAGTCTTFLQLWSSLGRDLILSPLIDCAQLGLKRGRKKAQEEEGEEGQVQVFLEKGRQGQERQEGQEGPQAAAQEATTQLVVRFRLRLLLVFYFIERRKKEAQEEEGGTTTTTTTVFLLAHHVLPPTACAVARLTVSIATDSSRRGRRPRDQRSSRSTSTRTRTPATVQTRAKVLTRTTPSPHTRPTLNVAASSLTHAPC